MTTAVTSSPDPYLYQLIENTKQTNKKEDANTPLEDLIKALKALLQMLAALSGGVPTDPKTTERIDQSLKE